MKKLFFALAAIALFSISFSSCTVEKRVHQDGYHISWKHRHAASSETFSNKESQEESNGETLAFSSTFDNQEIANQPNVYSVESISASTTESFPVLPKKNKIIRTHRDTIIPEQKSQQEEYFSNKYELPTNELHDTKLANWALGLGIGAVSAPLWVTLLFLLIFTLAGAAWSSVTSWTALALAFIFGIGIFLTLEILAITFAVRFLRMHAKDPNYRLYRSRAITGLILAGIYPALILINLVLGVFLAI